MAKRVHIARQEETVIEQGLQIRSDDPAKPADNQLWLNVSTNTINIAQSGGIIRLNDSTATETIKITGLNLMTKTITVSKEIQHPSKTKIFPQGGPAQIYSADFTVISPNIISWGNMGLDGLLEIDDQVVIEYF
jgi:hypothetical protein